MRLALRRSLVLLLVVVVLGLQSPAAPKSAAQKKDPAARLPLTRLTYRGWPESYILGNGKVEAVVVPAIGRVMQFRFAGESEGPFFENRRLDGRRPNPRSSEWDNFGGDKSWPAPQEQWGEMTGRNWPPPAAFDALANQARVQISAIELVSAVEPSYGIRVHRFIHLEPDRPVMTITTTFEKVSGVPVRVAVWVITQLKDPQRVYLPIPPGSIFPAGFVTQMGPGPFALRNERGLLSLARDPRHPVKIGNDAGTLLWVGDQWSLRIDSPRVPGVTYANRTSAEVYTNPDTLPYVELEMVGPMHELKVGDTLSRTSTYRLLRNPGKPPDETARRLLNQR